jgi:hypothetical protein
MNLDWYLSVRTGSLYLNSKFASSWRLAIDVEALVVIRHAFHNMTSARELFNHSISSLLTCQCFGSTHSSPNETPVPLA